jgi:hypothetical protein
MQRILSIYDWQKLPVGSQAVIKTDLDHQRTVRLKVNAQLPMSLFIRQDDYEDEIFLAYIVGLDEIQFQVQGDYTLIPLGGDVWFQTLDGADPSVQPVEPASFTQIVERQVRNPEIELMERRMAENMERRMAILTEQVAVTLAMKDAEIVAARTAAEAANKSEPVEAVGAVAPVEPAAPVAGGNGGVQAVE